LTYRLVSSNVKRQELSQRGRTCDFINGIDPSKITVIGHSRLGKTALLCAALDDRFYGAVSNDSGCSGAAVSLGKKGETIADITEQFPFWFCENYMKYAGKEKEAPFDQHSFLPPWRQECYMWEARKMTYGLIRFQNIYRF